MEKNETRDANKRNIEISDEAEKNIMRLMQ